MYKDCQVTQIMAQAKNGCIGDKNTIPWRCRADMMHFAANTKGKVCIMGRKTFDSINPPLKNRTVIVVTSDPMTARAVQEVDMHTTVKSVEAALEMASGLALSKEIMIVGGATIYKQTMGVTDRLILSTIDTVIEGDTFADWEIPDHVEIVPFEFTPEPV